MVFHLQVKGFLAYIKAVYEKQIDIRGKTLQSTKTTYDPSGNIFMFYERQAQRRNFLV